MCLPHGRHAALAQLALEPVAAAQTSHPVLFPPARVIQANPRHHTDSYQAPGLQLPSGVLKPLVGANGRNRVPGRTAVLVAFGAGSIAASAATRGTLSSTI
ncbi:hypothetical protein GCM10007977_006320 [Dactylosporangium sucinum]|uniref:Uncharacterized protein n=1 Tax=Dactylosporangium sucinum TaxID=1424081 RepID=A0A917T225_9ACTN|nr:hypothetical protein GCM10007977_006320 [Dactylosporangium sucinum]